MKKSLMFTFFIFTITIPFIVSAQADTIIINQLKAELDEYLILEKKQNYQGFPKSTSSKPKVDSLKQNLEKKYIHLEDWVGDMNQDGEVDYLFKKNKKRGYSYYLVITQNQQLSEVYELPFIRQIQQEVLLSVTAITDGKILATLGLKKTSISNSSNQEQVDLAFVLRDGRLVEESYLNCPNYKADGHHLLQGVSHLGSYESIIKFNEFYELTYQESVKFPSPIYFTNVKMSGCLPYYIEINIGGNEELIWSDSATSRRAGIVESLQTLYPHFTQQKLISDFLLELKKLDEKTLMELGGVYSSRTHLFKLPDNWYAKLNLNENSFYEIKLLFMKIEDFENFKENLSYNFVQYIRKRKEINPSK